MEKKEKIPNITIEMNNFTNSFYLLQFPIEYNIPIYA